MNEQIGKRKREEEKKRGRKEVEVAETSARPSKGHGGHHGPTSSARKKRIREREGGGKQKEGKATKRPSKGLRLAAKPHKCCL